ncbi:mCG145013, partial [Mus musculus]
ELRLMVGSNCQLLATPPKELSLEIPVHKCLLTTGTVSGLATADRMDPQGEWCYLDLWPFWNRCITVAAGFNILALAPWRL